MTLAKIKEQDGMTLAKVKEQDADDTCKSKTIDNTHTGLETASREQTTQYNFERHIRVAIS